MAAKAEMTTATKMAKEGFLGRHARPCRVIVGSTCVLILWSLLSISYLWHPVQFQSPAYQAVNTILNTQRAHHTESSSTATTVNAITKSSGDIFYDTDESYLMPQLKRLGLHVSTHVGKRHQKVRTEFERRLMNTPPLQDFRLAPDELKSKVHLISPRPSYHTGDVVRFRVDLYDGYGHPRQAGGDEIRMRLTSQPGSASIAAEVVDLRNGSYLGTTSLQWNGTASVQVYLMYPREFIREAVRVRLAIHATWWIGAVFQDQSFSETTACLPSLPIPGYEGVCNFTGYNGGLGYFCGRPTHRRLRCDHRQHFKPLKEMSYFPLSPPNEELMNKMDRKPYLRLIPNTISINILPGAKESSPDLPPCWKTSPNSTWHHPAPRGWMDKEGVWRPLTCSLPLRVHAQHVQNCLRNTSVFLVGDSNMRYWWYGLRRYLNCSVEEGGHIHRHRLCEVRPYNTTLKWAFHGRPTSTSPASENVPLPLALAELRHHQRHLHRRVVLVLHYFLHFSFYSLGEFVDRVRAAKKYIQDFLREFPKAQVFIRGPHVILRIVQGKYLGDGDIFGPAYIQVWKEEFRDLWDRVTFLDFWDMTIAAQNGPLHPEPSTIGEMVKVLLGHMCGDIR